jgi:hypothetical protein
VYTSLAEKLTVRDDAEWKEQPLVRRRTVRRSHAGLVHHRSAGEVSPMAILGFLLASAMICLVIYGHIQLDRINDQQVEVTTQLSTLQSEYQMLAARYEQTFDLEDIEDTMTSSGTMNAPTAEQQVYMDLSQPDSAVTFR